MHHKLGIQMCIYTHSRYAKSSLLSTAASATTAEEEV
jgi:hypothetical protein